MVKSINDMTIPELKEYAKQVVEELFKNVEYSEISYIIGGSENE